MISNNHQVEILKKVDFYIENVKRKKVKSFTELKPHLIEIIANYCDQNGDYVDYLYKCVSIIEEIEKGKISSKNRYINELTIDLLEKIYNYLEDPERVIKASLDKIQSIVNKYEDPVKIMKECYKHYKDGKLIDKWRLDLFKTILDGFIKDFK